MLKKVKRGKECVEPLDKKYFPRSRTHTPTVHLNGHARFKISANQSIFPPPSLFSFAPCSPAAPLYSHATRLGVPAVALSSPVVPRIILRRIFFEKVLSSETQRKQSNTNWHLILQAPYHCQLCSQRRGRWVCCVRVGGG